MLVETDPRSSIELLNCVVIDVAVDVRRGYTSHDDRRVNLAPKRLDAADDGAGNGVQLEESAARTWNIDEAVGQHGMEDRFPKVGLRSRRRPIAGEAPGLDQLPVLPLETVLAPNLGRVRVLVIGAGLEFHVDVAAVDERYLIVGQQIVLVGRHLLRNERVVHDARQYVVERLSCHTYLARMLRIERPLWPELRVSGAREQQQAGNCNRQFAKQ